MCQSPNRGPVIVFATAGLYLSGDGHRAITVHSGWYARLSAGSQFRAPPTRAYLNASRHGQYGHRFLMNPGQKPANLVTQSLETMVFHQNASALLAETANALS